MRPDAAAGAAAAAEWSGGIARRALGLAPSPGLDRRAGVALGVGAPLLLAEARLAPVAVLAVWALGATRERRRRAARRRVLVAELADGIPLLQLAVAGGLTVRAAIAEVAPWLAGPLGAELRRALVVAERSALADALDQLGERAGPPARPLAAVLAAADRYGAPLDRPLAQLAFDARLTARRLAEEEARRVPVRLLFPLVAGVLPAFVLLTIVPLLVSSLGAVRLPPP